MIRATAVVPRAAVRPERVADRITLDHGDRHRRRIALTGQCGLAFLLDLDKAAVINDGDAVALEDGRLVEVRAAPERLVEIACDAPLLLKRVIWHLGNRHVPAEITDDAVYIAEDHVLIDMVRGLGAKARLVHRPFRPERGAYDHGDHAISFPHAEERGEAERRTSG
jgi:urease accessory protein